MTLDYTKLEVGKTYLMNAYTGAIHRAVVRVDIVDNKVYGYVVWDKTAFWDVGARLWLGIGDTYEELTEEEVIAFKLSS